MAWLIFGTWFLVDAHAPLWVKIAFVFFAGLEFLDGLLKADPAKFYLQAIMYDVSKIKRKLDP